MKRIARLEAEPFTAGDSPIAHDELVNLLRTQLSPAVASLFAKPKAADGGLVEWYSDLNGQPVPVSQLPPGEAAQVQRLLEERITAIQQLAARLESQGGEGARQAALLRQAVQYPDTRTLYSLNGQPVLTFWGYRLAGSAPVGAVPLAAGAVGAAATLAPNRADAAAPPLTPPPSGPLEPPRKRRWWPWLLLLLLLALLAGVLWWLSGRDEEVPPMEPPVVEEPIEEPAEQTPIKEPEIEEELPLEEPPVEEPPVEEPELPEEIPEPEPTPVPPPPDPFDELTKKVAATTDCTALENMLKDEPQLQGSDAQAQTLKQQIRTTLDGRCKQEQAQKEKVQQAAKQAQIQQAKNQCPGQRPPELAPELIIVFDASGSMKAKLPLTAQEQAQRQATQEVIRGLGGLIGGNTGRTVGRSVEKATIGDPPTRMSAAKEAASSVVRRTPRDMNIGLVVLDDCPSAQSRGYFTPSQRGNLQGLIQSMQPKSGTPLGNAIAQAGQMLDGVNRASLMVVISDGQESCGTNPCVEAKRLAQSKPNLTINVVDIMGSGAGNCVAAATGGRVFTAKSVKELNVMMTQATQEVLGPGHCP